MVIMMRKILYKGDLSPATINILDSRYVINTGDILELDDSQANKVLENYNFIEVNKIESKPATKTTVKTTVNMDLNADGKVDSADASIAGKVLSNIKKNK